MVRRIALLTLLTSLLAGCAQRGAEMTFAQAAAKANDGKRVSLQGFIRYQTGATPADGVLALDLNGRAGGGEGVFLVNATIGTGPDQVEPPEVKSSQDNVKIHVHDGTVATSMDKVRVTGVLRLRDLAKVTYTLIPPLFVERANP